MLSKCTAKPDSNSKFHRKNATVYTRVRTRNVFLKSNSKKRLWLEHVSKVCSHLALLLRFYSVFCVEAVFGSLGLLGLIFDVFFKVFTAFVENGVRETAVRVHIGAQNCGKNATFLRRLDKNSVFRNSSVCLAPVFFCIFTAVS